MAVNQSGPSVLVPSLLLAIAALVGCPKNPTHPTVPPPGISKATYDAYRKAGWIPLLEPDSRFTPGTIFAVHDGMAPEWLSSLASCGVPKDALTAVSNNSGQWKATDTGEYSANAVLAIHGISLGPKFDKNWTATLDQSEYGVTSFDIVAVTDWMKKNPTAISSTCKDLLGKPDVYIARESYQIGKGTYTLKDSGGASINLKAPKVLSLSADADAKRTGDSSLTLAVPVYTAVHGAIYANQVLELLSSNTSRGSLDSADNTILAKLPY